MHRTWLMTGSEAAAVCLKDPAAPPSESTLCGWTGSCRAAPKLPCACLVGTQTAGRLWKGPWPVTRLRLSCFPTFKLVLPFLGRHVPPSQSQVPAWQPGGQLRCGGQ